VHDVPCVTTQSAEKSAVTIHDDEAKLLIRLEKLTKRFSVELIVTQIQGRVDGLERLEVNINLPLLALGRNNFTAVYHEPVRRHFVVQFETLLSRCDGGQNGLTVDSRLDVGGGTLRKSARSMEGYRVDLQTLQLTSLLHERLDLSVLGTFSGVVRHTWTLTHEE